MARAVGSRGRVAKHFFAPAQNNIPILSLHIPVQLLLVSKLRIRRNPQSGTAAPGQPHHAVPFVRMCKPPEEAHLASQRCGFNPASHATALRQRYFEVCTSPRQLPA